MDTFFKKRDKNPYSVGGYSLASCSLQNKL